MQSAGERAQFTIPFRYLKPDIPTIMVPVEINGRGPFEFILDTGNGKSPFLLSPRLATELGLDLAEFAPHVGYCVGADRNLMSGRVDSAKLGGISVRCPEVAIAPALEQIESRLRSASPEQEARIQGNVGYPFLKDYSLTLDFSRSEMTLSTARVEGSSAAMTIMEGAPLIQVQVLANGRPLNFVLDTGASSTCISLDAAERLVLARGQEIDINLSGDSKGYLTQLSTLAVGDAEVRNLTVVAADFMAGLSAELGITIDGILGHNFWSRYRMTIDYPGAALLLEPTA